MSTLPNAIQSIVDKVEIWEERDFSVRDLQGIAAPHSAPPPFRVLAAPATADEHNTIRQRLITVACWRLNDARFAFDSSFVSPEARKEIGLMAQLVKDHPRCPASVFGHADATGDDDYNKALSGRRAMAIYGVLARDTSLWEYLHANSHGADVWDNRVIDTMKHALSPNDPSALSGVSRTRLYLRYMDFLCTDEDTGAVFVMQEADFLGKGTDSKGKADFQGCGEFNPIVVFSQQEVEEFEKPENHARRDVENGVNRRVVVYLFEEGTLVDPKKWPCPRVTDGTAGCRTRFWSDGEKRRTPGAEKRSYEVTGDTVACLFYHRMANESPCECPGGTKALNHISILLRSNSGSIPLAKRAYKITIGDGITLEGMTDDEGYLYHPHVAPDEYVMELEGKFTFLIPSLPVHETPYVRRVPGYFI